MASSVVMMTTVSADTTGDKIQADGYYGYADGLHTVVMYTTGYTGLLSIQATLASTPASLSTHTTIICVSNFPCFPGTLYADFDFIIKLKFFLF